VTTASWRLASARKRIIRQLRRETVCCRIRSNFSFTSGCVGCAAGESVLFALTFRHVRFHIFLTSKIEGDRAINLLEGQYRIMRPNGLGRLSALTFSHDVV
jgi:hypothetical protein